MSARRFLMPALAAVFVISGFALMIASLGIESASSHSPELAADVVVPTAVTTATAAASEPRARQLVVHAQQADRTLSYGGTKLVSRWTNGVPTNVYLIVDHVPGSGTVVAPGATSSDALDAAAQVTIGEGSQDADSVMMDALMHNYRLTVTGAVASVAGRRAQVVVATRADGIRAAQFYFDESTGLLMRRDVMDAHGATLESTSFVNVVFRAAPPTAAAVSDQQGWTTVTDKGTDELRSTGWPIPAALPAGMELYQVREQHLSGSPVVQLSYTDGLTAISVFLQQGALDASSLKGYEEVDAAGGRVWVRSTGTRFLTWQAKPAAGTGDIVVSVTTDSLGAPTGSAIAAFPPVAAGEDGVGDHVTRGVQRVGSWFDPLN